MTIPGKEGVSSDPQLGRLKDLEGNATPKEEYFLRTDGITFHSGDHSPYLDSSKVDELISDAADRLGTTPEELRERMAAGETISW